MTCFLDESSIYAGDPFPETIGDAIKNCSIFVIILSDNITASPWVETEIREARVANKWLVPYRVNQSVGRPEQLDNNTACGFIAGLFITTRKLSAEAFERTKFKRP